MEGPAKAEWFREQKALNPEKFKKKVTSSSQQKDVKADEDMKHDVVDGQCKTDFCMEHCVMGLTLPEAEKKWEEALADDSVEKEWHQGSRQWLVKRFRGTRALTGSRTSKEQHVNRDVILEDGQGMEEAEAQRKAAAATSAAWLRKTKNARAAGSCEMDMQEETIDEHDMRVQNSVQVIE